jgi:serine/threonine protein kinase
MAPSCPHQVSAPSDGAFLSGHCPQCLLGIALDSDQHAAADEATGFSESVDSLNETISFTPGTILGDRFRLVALVARGGMGEVYRADDLKLGQPVALKFLPAAVSSDAEALRRISSEVRLGRQVAHPNVCRLYDLAEAQDHHFIVMELVDGEHLGSLLARIGGLPVSKAMELARDLCAGLAACHDRGVVHGDLKPGNVMIDGKGRARIMDFGLSTILGSKPEDRLVAGTLAYMAPEQLHGTGPSAQADLYALGLILYEMFTGRRVHDVRTIDQLKQAMDSLPAPLSTLTRVPQQIEDMILQCLERKPGRRPRSAAEVAKAFPSRDPISDALAAGETPSPAMVAASEKVGDLSLRSAWWMLGAAALGLLLSIAGAERFTAIGRTPFRHSPEVLAQQAREVARSVAYPLRNADEAYGFTTRGRLRSRNEPPSSSLAFFYRQGSRRLTPVMSLRRTSPNDPPSDVPGMATIGLDPEGSLRFLRVLPPEMNAAPPRKPIAWEDLFALAKIEALATTESEWIPSVPYQEKHTWTAQSQKGVMVRGALYRGRAVYFDIDDDSTGRLSAVVAEEDRFTRHAQKIYVGLLVLSFIAGGLLAQRNVRKGRSDLRGARRVAGLVLGCRLLFWIFSADIGWAEVNAQVLVRGIGQALFESAQVWLAYVALEPFVRRRWPQLIIGWNRLIDGRFSDPLVGRDFLVGGFAGILLVLVEQLRGWNGLRLGLPASQPLPLTLEVLSGSGEVMATLFYCVARALVFALLGLFLFLLMRSIVHRPVIAGTLWIVAATMTWIRGEQMGAMLSIVLTVAIVQAVLALLVMVRFGLLAAVSMFFAYLMLSIAPLTFDLRSWYAIASMVPVLTVAGLLAFGFHAALGRKPLFGRRILEA